MDGDIDENAVLDYATFHLSPSQNSFEVSVYSDGKNEKMSSSGHLDELVWHLPSVKNLDTDTSDLFKLQPAEGSLETSWFKKTTLNIFLNITNTPGAFKKANAIQKELLQLEDTRSFHVALYNKDKQAHAGDPPTEVGCLKEVESTQRMKIETVSSDATKNELLRALDLRLMALRTELVETLDQLLGSQYSKGQISNLVSLVGHFGNPDFRNMLLKYLTLKFEDANTLDEKPELMNSKKCAGNMTEGKPLVFSRAASALATGNGVSPAKIAQAERKSPTESEESSNSSDEDQSFAERSRPVIRSASPRRSASPMRRVQIGRSGSRRAAALTIKSLSYIPAREKIFLNKDANESDSEDESSEKQPKKPESATTRMSVQDRINLFESRQRDQTSDIQKRSSGTEPSLGATKSVLRRWSSGSSLMCQQETSSDGKCENSSNTRVLCSQQSFAENDSDIPITSSKSVDSARPLSTVVSKELLSSPASDFQDLVASQSEDAPDRAAASAEWTRQKEAELSQLMKMMETKTGKSGNMMCGSGDKGSSTEQKGDFYSQYKEKRDKKLRTAGAGRRAEKEAKFKGTQNVIEQRTVEIVKKVGAPGKVSQSVQAQKLRRNSSPPLLPSKSSSTVHPKKMSPKSVASPALTKRNSLPLTPSPKTTGAIAAKTSSKAGTTTPAIRKPLSAASPVIPGALSERARQPKEAKSLVTESKFNSKSNEEKKPKATLKSTKSLKTKSPTRLMDDSVHMPAKPSFYNKVTRKSSIVPLEPKPFLRKGMGVSSSVGPAKLKPSQTDDSSKNGEVPLQIEVKETIPVTPEKIIQPSVLETVEQTTDASKDYTSIAEIHINEGEANDTPLIEACDSIIQPAESPQLETELEDDLGISSAAWVDSDHQSEHEFPCNQSQTSVPGDIVPVTLASPRVRHSLSQMLQADSTESEIIEWGNAENPPALVYQKDAPKGLKRLLKFARKSKGESNTTGWSSPSVFSDGDEDTEESKTISKKSDALARKATSKSKMSGRARNLLSESFDSGNSSKRLNDHSATHDMLSASMSGLPPGIHKMRDGNGPVTNSSKGSRSFFSLSTFRSNR